MYRKIFSILVTAAVAAFVALTGGCSNWTDSEALDFFSPKPTEESNTAYDRNIKEYLKSPHRVMYGWFGSWSGKSNGPKGGSLMGLPDSVDFVSLWLCWGNLSQAQQADLKEFQARGHRAVLCWRLPNIGSGLTPAGENEAQFWGYADGTAESYKAAAEKYAMAIADTCRKYNIDGFDADLEDRGTLIPNYFNDFARKLIEEFEKDGRMFMVDIPGGVSWLSPYYSMLADDVIDHIQYIAWQTYEMSSQAQLNSFFNSVRSYKPHKFEHVMTHSIITATFERAADKHYFLEQINNDYTSTEGYKAAGYGAYHIEYDYSSSDGPDYPTVRRGISVLNPPVTD